ncbi:hypothetical protein K2173_000909 [Erythroxylum novogranatense]|uniref:C3H1-type domain-containing protein n=1 Tax=Erythroxylum novogranatense TaxID=1862640 RepID=A0AAV8TSS0_9ROSI|nr:hypothetical protein K2173_000909 [Erythroxylum novogranatense]
MSGTGRKRRSKWDLKEEPRNSLENVRENSWTPKASLPLHDREAARGWYSPDTTDGDHPKWSAVETLSGRRSSWRDDNIQDRSRTLKAMPSWHEEQSYGTKMSPGLDDWRQQDHRHSPKNEWKRSRRSRSRSRSRSSVPGYRRESGYDRSRNRSALSAQICKDFTAGRCRRGNLCDFLHQGHEDTSERHRKTAASKYSTSHDTKEHPLGSGRGDDCCTDFLKGNCRRGASCRFAHHGSSDTSGRWSKNGLVRDRDSDRRTRDVSPERRGERETHRAADIPCKFFASGNCRNGKHCRFYHQGQGRSSPESTRDNRLLLGQNSGDLEKARNDPKWDNVRSSSHTTKSSLDKKEAIGSPLPRLSPWSMDDKWVPTIDAKMTETGHKAVENDTKQSLEWKTDIPSDSMRPEQRATENWLGDMDMSPDWNPRLQPPNHVDDRERSSLPGHDSGVTQNTLCRVHNDIAVIPPPSFTQQRYNLGEAGPVGFPHAIVGGRTAASMSISANSLGAHGFNQDGLGSNVLPLPHLNVIGQNQVSSTADPSRYGATLSTQNQTMFLDRKAADNLVLGEANSSSLNSGSQMPQGTVSSGNLTPLSNIEASLVQLLANGQQLPQLFSAHNPQNEADVETVHPNRAVAPEKQYDPIFDSIEPEKQTLINYSLGLSSSTVVQDSFVERKHDNLPSSSFAGAENSGHNNVLGSSVREPNDESHQSDQLEPDSEFEALKKNNGGDTKESMEIQTNNAQDSGSPEKIDEDDKHGENRKNKDVKGIRAFKFALVEFVKEILKPTWKEGQMSKDAYKNIVKKVVDKVTGTMKVASLPQTQEKIEQYLSFAKPKLTKLTQAYVEKFQKNK